MILLLLMLLVPPEAERLYALGNTLLDEGDARGAVAAYRGALETGWTSTALELRLGLAYVETGELGRAVLHTERARQIGDDEATAVNNLRLLRTRLDLEPAPRPPSEAAAQWLAERVGVVPLATLALLLYLAVAALAGHAIWARAPWPARRRILLVLVPLGLAAALAAVGASWYETTPRAVVVADTAVVRNAPTAEAGRRGEVFEGALLTVTDRRGSWLEVRLADGATGWARTDAVEEL